jgi:CRISPR system Cascade subunit CasD
LATLAAISNALGYAVRTDATGHSLTDWHTVRIGDGAPAKRARTRAEELAVGATPLITQREYRTDALHTVAVWERDSGQYRLEAIAEALRRPQWVLYLGRKACPLGLPVNPEIIKATTLKAAFALRPALPPQVAPYLPIRLDEPPHIASDDDAPGIDTLQTETRFDLRDGRQWRHRVEHIMEA